MLEKAFQDVYTKFKLHFYQNVFQRFATREATLTTVESFCMEGIMAMGEPTIAEFSRMMQISTPNAAYKIGSLPHPEVYRLLQHQLLLPAHRSGACPAALYPRGMRQAGTDAYHREHRADAGTGHAEKRRGIKTIKRLLHKNVQQPFCVSRHSTINSVPAVMRAQPIRLLAVKGSCSTTKASARVMTTLSLSIGTTLDAAPICNAW